MRSILVIEDDIDVRESMLEFLHDEGYEVVVAANGLEGLQQLARRDDWSVILLDLQMPMMDGREFREHQLGDARYAAVPIVLLTGTGDIEDPVKELQAAGFISKPFRLDLLIQVVEQHCR